MLNDITGQIDGELKTVGKNTLIYSIGNIAIKSVTFFFIPLYTHYLSVFEVGIIVLLELLELFYNAVAPLGVFSAVWRYFTTERKSGTEKKFISSNILFVLAVNAVLATLLIVCAPSITKIYLSEGSLSNLVRVFIIILFLGLSRTVIVNLLRIYEQAFRFIVFVFVDFVLLILLTLGFVIGLDLGLWGIIYAKLITSGLIFFFAVFYILKQHGLHYDHKDVIRSLRFGFPLMFNGISMLILSMSDRFFIKEIISVEASGIYGISYKFGMILNMVFVVPLMQAWHPILFRLENAPEQKVTYQKIALYYVQIGSLLMLAIVVASKYLLKITTTEEYHYGIIIVPWIAFSYLLFGLQNIFKAGALIHNQTIKMTQYGLLTAGLNIILNMAMIPTLGILGAAIATTLSYFVLMVLILRLSHKYLHINWLWRKMIPVILLGMIFSWLASIDLNKLQLNFAKDATVLILLPTLMLLLKLVSLKEIKRFALRLKGAF